MEVASGDPVLETCAQILDHTALQTASVAQVLTEVVHTLRSAGYNRIQSVPFAHTLELAEFFERTSELHRELEQAVTRERKGVAEDPTMLTRVAELAADTAHSLGDRHRGGGMAQRFGVVTALLEREGLEHRARHVRTLVPYVVQLRRDCERLNVLCSSTTQPILLVRDDDGDA